MNKNRLWIPAQRIIYVDQADDIGQTKKIISSTEDIYVIYYLTNQNPVDNPRHIDYDASAIIDRYTTFDIDDGLVVNGVEYQIKYITPLRNEQRVLLLTAR